MVRDSFWLHAYWELSRTGVERAEAAMGQEWHSAKPVSRVFEVSNNGSTTSAERLWRTIEIHGGVNNWYIDVIDPPKSYRLDIGYLSLDGKFFVLCRSNVVTTPVPGTSDAIDGNWAAVAEDFEKVYALSGGYSAEGPNLELQQLFEERLRRPMGSPMATRSGPGPRLWPARSASSTSSLMPSCSSLARPNRMPTSRCRAIRYGCVRMARSRFASACRTADK